MGGHEGHPAGFRKRYPSGRSRGLLPCHGNASVNAPGPSAVGERVADPSHVLPNLDADTRLGRHKVPERFRVVVTRGDLTSRKGPKASEQPRVAATDEERPAARVNEREGNGHRLRRACGPGPWEGVLQASMVSQASISEWTGPARRAGGRAHGRSQLHEGLIERTRPSARNELAGQLGNPHPSGPRRDVGLDCEQARQDPGHVAVDGRDGLPECDRRDRTGRVGTDPGERSKRRRGRGDAPAMVLDNRLRGGMEVARAAVEPEALPSLEDLLLRGGGEGLHIGEPGHKPLVVRGPGDDPRALEEHLGHQDAVRVLRAPPRHVPVARIEPGEQPRLDFPRRWGFHADAMTARLLNGPPMAKRFPSRPRCSGG